MKIAVIGASGFVGRAITHAAETAGHEVVKLSAPRFSCSRRTPNEICLEILDLQTIETEKLSRSLTGVQVVVNAAGLATPGSRLTDSLVGGNALLPGVIVAAAISAGAKRVLHVSSAAVHGDATTLDSSETPIPTSPYGQTKLWGETVAKKIGKNNIEVVIYRPTSVHGSGRRVTELVTRIAKSPLASVSKPHDAPTPQIFVEDVGNFALELVTQSKVPATAVIHPWAGWTVSSFLERMGDGHRPIVIPRNFALLMLGTAKFFGKFNSGVLANARRLEMLWFGQKQVGKNHDDYPMALNEPTRKLTIGLLTQWYDPEPGPASLPGSLARGLAERGFQVKVLTGVPNYPHGKLYPGFKNARSTSKVDSAIQVTRVPLYADHSGSAVKRALNYVSFACSARIFGRNALRGIDLLWVYNSPPSVVYPLRQQKRVTGVPVFTHIMDLWPESFLATDFSGGALQKLALKYFESLAKKTYALSDRIAYISPGIRQILLSRAVEEDRLTYLPTWVEPSLETAQLQEFELDFEPSSGKRTLVYAGAIGSVQRLDLIVEAMLQNPDLPIELLIIGIGTAKEELVTQASRAKNISFLPPVAQHEMHAVYAIADLMLISLGESELAKTTTPSKFSQILQKSVPIVAIGEGDILKQVLQANAGLVASPNLQAVTETLHEIAYAPQSKLEDWGRSGGDFYRKNHSYPVLMDRISTEFKDLILKETGDAK